MKLINYLKRQSYFRTLKKVFGFDKDEVKALSAMKCTASFVTPLELTTEDYLECCATEEEADEQFNRTYELVKRLSAYRKIEEMQRKALGKGARLRIEQEELIQRLIKCQ
jgi:hypothetical protein